MNIENQILELGREKNFSSLGSYLKKLGTKQVNALISRTCGRQAAPELLNFLFQAVNQEQLTEITVYDICQQLLHELQKQSISTVQSNALMTIITIELDHLESNELVKLTNWCMESLQQSADQICWKGVLPKLLSLLKQREVIEHDGVEMKGTDFKDRIINSLCMAKWKPEIITPLASMFLDVPMSPDQHLQVVYKICKCMVEIPPNKIPPLVNQLLWLCEDQHSLPLFLELQNYFTSRLYVDPIKKKKSADIEAVSDFVQDSGNQRELQRAESTVLFYISQAAAGGHAVVKELTKSLKNVCNAPEFVLNPFLISVLLCMSSVSSSEEQIFDILRSAIIRMVEEEERRNQSAWISDMVPKAINVQEIFSQVVESSLRERDRVISGLVKLSFILLNVTKLKTVEEKPEKIWALGRYILVAVVKKQPDVANNVVQQLLQQIFDHKNTQFIDCLHKLCKDARLGMMDSIRSVLPLLDNIILLPENTATEVIRAILPLLRDSSSLRTSLTIILRKSMYSRNTETRKMAVSGLLLFLKHMDVRNLAALSQSSCSQSDTESAGLATCLSQIDVHGDINSLGNEATCIELLNILRRCFMQQSSVRLCLYQGLYDAVCKNPVLLPHAMELLLQHFNNYYQSAEQTLPPVDFSKVVEIKGSSTVLKEPLANLIYVIQQLTMKPAKCSGHYSQTAEKLNMMLESLTERMIKCSLDDLGLENTINLLDTLPECQQGMEILIQSLGIYEALMAYVISSWKKESSESGQKLWKLFQGYCRLIDFAKSNSKPRKKDKESGPSKGKSVQKSLKLPSTLMDFETINKLLNLLYRSVDWASFEAVSVVKGRREFHQYVMTTCLQLVQQAKTVKSENGHLNVEIYKNCTIIASTIYEKCVSRVTAFCDFDKVTCEASIECFYEIVSLISNYYKTSLPQFLETITNIPKSDGLIQQLTVVINKMQESLKEIVNSDEQQCDKTVEMLISTFSHLSSVIPKGCELCNKVFDWVREFAQETAVDNQKITKNLLTLLFKIFVQYKSTGSLYGNMSLNLLSIFGTVEEGSSGKEKFTRFHILSDNTKEIALVILCNALRGCLADINWIIERLHSEYTARAYSSDYSIESRKEFLKSKERDVCCQTSHCVTVINNLAKLAVSPGASSATLFRLLTSLYTTLSSLTKYFFIRSSKLDPAFQGARFTQVITLAGRHLAKNYDALISHIEEMEGEDNGNKKKKINNWTLKSKLLKGAKSRTSLLFEREQFEQLIIKLSTKTKIDLMQHVKQNASRDFHISSKKLCKALDEQNRSEDSSDSILEGSKRQILVDSATTDNMEQSNPAKKQRTV